MRCQNAALQPDILHHVVSTTGLFGFPFISQESDATAGKQPVWILRKKERTGDVRHKLALVEFPQSPMFQDLLIGVRLLQPPHLLNSFYEVSDEIFSKVIRIRQGNRFHFEIDLAFVDL